MEKLKPCPFCNSKDVDEDYTSVQPTLSGNEHQHGWIYCNACGAAGPTIHAKNEQINDIVELVRKAWNTRHKEGDKWKNTR